MAGLALLCALYLAPSPLNAQTPATRVSVPTADVPCCAFVGLSGDYLATGRGRGGGFNLDFTLQDPFSAPRPFPDFLVRVAVNRIARHPGGDFEMGLLQPFALSRDTKTHLGLYAYPEGVVGTHFGAPYHFYAAGGGGLMLWLGKVAPFVEARWRQPMSRYPGSVEITLGVRIAAWD